MAQSFLRPARVLVRQSRWLNLQEYHSKGLMEKHGLTVQRFRMAESVEQAKQIASTFKVREFVIKAQILAGGRGKGTFSNGFKGGVHLTKDPSAVPKIVGSMLGNKLTTKQTSKEGVLVHKVMVAEALDIARETYVAIVMDRDSCGPVLIGSPMGGMDIEEVAHSNPSAIFKHPIDITKGLLKEDALKMAKNLKFTGSKADDAANQIQKLYELFVKVDATQVEINPFGETPDGQVVCFDAKINFDDNAYFRQQPIHKLDDMSESDPREVAAAASRLNYIGMSGNIACLVNGAGLAMATMDIIHLHGAAPANFLDVGGTVQEAQVVDAFRIITSDKQVKAILVNIFGGIVNCATIANGLINACRKIDLKIPLVVRLEGTNVREAKLLLKNSALPIISANNLDDAATKAVAALSGL